jgi:hypothetical protein
MTREVRLSLRIRKWMLSTLNKSLCFLFAPFIRAQTLNAYASYGYAMLGIFSVGVYVYLWSRGYFSYPLSRSAPFLQSLYGFLVDELNLGFIPDSVATVGLIPFFLYAAGFAWKPARLWLGEKCADFFFWLVGRSIVGGEWCIEHRWQTLVVIIFLVSLLTAGVYRQFERQHHENLLAHNFDDWLKHAADFVDQNPLASLEQERYEHVRVFWKNSFVRLHAAPGSYKHPAIHLNEILGIIYAEPSQESWTDTLRERLGLLEDCVARCRNSVKAQKSDSEAQAWALVNILMGRVYVRLVQDSNDFREFPLALAHFSEADSSDFRASAMNGKGTVYANAFTAYLEGSLNEEQRKALASICSTSYRCAIKALRAYKEAARDSAPCSFSSKRRDNNITDLLSRIGMHYDREAPPVALGDWITSPEALANGIHHRIRLLMACNSREPVVSSTFVTAAQGFASSARLRLLAEKDATGDVVASSTYLRLANSFVPESVSAWEAFYFCPMLKRSETKAVFVSTLSSSYAALPDATHLLKAIEQQCRSRI